QWINSRNHRKLADGNAIEMLPGTGRVLFVQPQTIALARWNFETENSIATVKAAAAGDQSPGRIKQVHGDGSLGANASRRQVEDETLTGFGVELNFVDVTGSRKRSPEIKRQGHYLGKFGGFD